MTHLTFDQLSELAERPPAAEDREPHLADCGDCRATLARVRGLISAAHALPREAAPPPELWGALRDRVRREPRVPARSRVWRAAWMSLSAIAATVALFVGSMLLSPTQPGRLKGAKPVTPTVRVVANVDQAYVATVDELRRALDLQRGALAPTTIRVVERSLATIDSAIAEARSALAADPANQALVQILSAHYERKVDLLQRATELPSS
jgi:anti-sigma-K factor RskA